ncbi:hypothetical protein FH972_026801 [Carpinus fangiana]|uniref:Uncharacterized protein n=1 Tax=Carpinus fangiana TaxID=176857 RepID=A0A5N6L518_9ROSI|nr:hypothetical protein FH972_026801 [Carpinus fangiana]
MAEFTPNLDDGEVWLPSDIFLSQVPSRPIPHHRSCMDDLTERFAAFTLLQPLRNVSKPSPNLERFRPVVRCGPVCRLPKEYMGVNGGLEVEEIGHGLYGPYFTGHKLAYEYQLLEPAQPQEAVDSFRSRVLRAQQNSLQNRLLPFQGSGRYGVGGGFVKESGGTGVFIPRTLNTATTETMAVLRNGLEIQVTQQGSYLNGIGMGQQRESHHYLPPETGLPQDWTY